VGEWFFFTFFPFQWCVIFSISIVFSVGGCWGGEGCGCGLVPVGGGLLGGFGVTQKQQNNKPKKQKKPHQKKKKKKNKTQKQQKQNKPKKKKQKKTTTNQQPNNTKKNHQHKHPQPPPTPPFLFFFCFFVDFVPWRGDYRPLALMQPNVSRLSHPPEDLSPLPVLF